MENTFKSDIDASSEKCAVVAMSGGVDSSVAALLLAEQGYSLIGVSMQVWDYRNNGGCSSKASCCAPSDFSDARKVASKLDIPYYVFDFEKTFRTEVIDKFVADYQQARTPNPCVDCNNKVKFKALRDRSLSLGFRAVATGHYAKIEGSKQGWRLFRAKDKTKDQSYFLYGLEQEELEHTVFPLAELSKPEVRELARVAGLNTAEKPESQDICFVSGSVQDFLVGIGGKSTGGNIVDRQGRVLGKHAGVQNFTIGQRRGIRVGGFDEPMYVVDLRPSENLVVIGKKEELELEGFKVEGVNWISPSVLERLRESELDGIEIDCIVQMRHGHVGERVRVIASRKEAKVLFKDSWAPVSPGQAAVFYDLENEEVLGGGTIIR